MEVSGRRTINEHQSTSEIMCQPCQEDRVVKQAYGYCLNCDEYLCETCYKYHRRQKLFKEHALVDEDIEKFQQQLEDVSPVPERKKVLNLCDIHSNEDLKYHCKTHKIIICSVCAIKQHKRCPNLLYIPEIFDSENEVHKRKVEYVQRKVEYKLNQERDARKLAEESYKSALLVLETQRKETNIYFEKMESHFNEKVSKFREESKKREMEMLQLGQTLKSKIEQMTGTTSGSKTEKYILMQKTEEEVKEINQQVLGVLGHPSIKLTYTPQQPLPQLGEAKVEEKQGELDRRKLKLQKKMNIAGGKERCSITDIAILSNNRLLLVLVDHLNKRLVVVSREYDVVFYQCSAEPWGVTCISETEVAVTLTEDEEVHFFDIRGTVTCADRNSIKVSGSPAGIRYYKSGCSLIISVYKDPSTNLELWSVSGQLLRTIASVDYDISYITLTAENQIVVSSAGLDHMVRLLNLDGTILRSYDYMDSNMFGPFGVASDACGNIYVCGKGCLRVVSKKGKWEQILHRDDGFAPQTVLVCDKTNRLFIGQAQGNKFADVLVYQM